MKYVATVEGKDFLVDIIDEKHVSVNGRVYEIDFVTVSGQPVYSLIADGMSHESYIARGDDGWQVLLRGRLYPVVVEDEREKRLRDAAQLVVAVPVEDGQEIKKGQVLLILESMKMQNELKSPRDGKVSRIKVKPGESVEQKQALLSVV